MITSPCNIIAILGPNLDGLGAVPDLEYVVVGLVSIGGLGSLEYVTVVNVGAALYVIGAKVGIYTTLAYGTPLLLSARTTEVNTEDSFQSRRSLPVTTFEAVGLVTYKYNGVLVDCTYSALLQLVVLNKVIFYTIGNNIITSHVICFY